VGGPERLQEKERVNWTEKLRKQCHHLAVGLHRPAGPRRHTKAQISRHQGTHTHTTTHTHTRRQGPAST